MSKEKNIQVEEESRRLDIYLSKKFSDYSRSFFQKLIKNGFVEINSKKILEPCLKLKKGDSIKIEFPEQKDIIKDSSLDVIYEDDSILVINKLAGLCVHPAGKFSLEPTLVDFLKTDNKTLTRSGIVHRLDRETSGIMVIAKTPQAQFSLMKQFQNRTIKKTYLGIVCGVPSSEKGSISAPLGRSYKNRKRFCVGTGRDAITDFKVIKRFNKHSLLEIYPRTGRTHQIRVHLSSIGHPILGDKLYGKKEDNVPRQMLHSYKISLIHPKKNKQMEWTAKIPKDFLSVLKRLKILFFILLFVSNYIGYGFTTTTNSTSTTNSVSTEIKGIKSELKKLTKELNKINKLSEKLETIEKNIKNQDVLYQNRLKEINMAVAELNRKITNLEINFEEYKRTSALEKIKQQDQKSKQKIEEIETQQTSSEISDKVLTLETEISLVKKDLAMIREKLGVSQAKEAQKNNEEDKIMKFLKSPWAVVTALGFSFLALIIAVF